MPPPDRATATRWFLLNAVLAWAGLAVSLTLDVLGTYPSTVTVASHYGYAVPDGVAGSTQRVADWVSYFTIWSNLTVAIVMTVLALGRARPSRWLRAARLDSVLMITVTAVVFAVVLAPTAHQRGWENLSNALLHQVTPLVTVLVWAVVGPRAWVGWDTVRDALVIPMAWVVWMLVRGAVTGTYPYGFVDVVTHGYAAVAVNLLGVLVMGVLVGVVFRAVDRLLARRPRAGAAAESTMRGD